MTKTEAHHLLDGARAGVPTPEFMVTLALFVTGDLYGARNYAPQEAGPAGVELTTPDAEGRTDDEN
jgi:hypothetical protein